MQNVDIHLNFGTDRPIFPIQPEIELIPCSADGFEQIQGTGIQPLFHDIVDSAFFGILFFKDKLVCVFHRLIVGNQIIEQVGTGDDTCDAAIVDDRDNPLFFFDDFVYDLGNVRI